MRLSQTSGSDKQDVVEPDPAEQARLLRKLHWNLLPKVTLIHLFSTIDRNNIGNARVAGMGTDLHLVGLRFNIAVAIFFVLYVLAEVPSNIILKLYRPSRWLPTITFSMGLIMTLMCLVDSYGGLLVARTFLGLTEAGVFPGVHFYISSWYPRASRAKPVAIFSAAAAAAGACNGILAYAIRKMDGIGGLHGWQWIFCLEGLATIVVASWAYATMCDYPETASFLTEAERHHIVQLLKDDTHELASHFEFKFVLQAFKDYKTYVQAGISIGALIPSSTIPLFLPTIVKELGFSAVNAQLLSIPPFIVGCITVVLVGVCSDSLKFRGPFMIFAALVSIVGYIILYTQPSPHVAYGGAVLALAGSAPIHPLEMVWAGSNAGGDMKRSVVLAIVAGIASLGGFCAAFVYFDPPRFHVGHGTMMGCLSLVVLLSAFAMWDYSRLNKQKEEQCRRHGITEDQRDEFKKMGDESPLFRYTI